jgi:hypothetical protein
MEQILAEQRRLQQAYDWSEYQRNRAREYPSVQEQLDALYHAGVFPPEMSARIQAVKAKYPRQFPDHEQTGVDTVSKMSVEDWLTQEAKTTVAPASSAMSVEEWLAKETKMTAEQWLAQQQSTTHMTREQWLVSQVNVKSALTAPTALTNTATTASKMSTEEWLAKETKMTAEQWLAQQQSTTYMTREQWLASQREILTPVVPEIANKTAPTMSAEQWLRQQSDQENCPIVQEQSPHMTREEWLAQQANAGN